MNNSQASNKAPVSELATSAINSVARKRMRLVVAGLAVLLLFSLLTRLELPSILPSDIARAQLFIFPLVVGLLLIFRYGDIYLPRPLIILATITAAYCAYSTYSISVGGSANVILSRLRGDDLDSKATVLEELVTGRLESNTRIVRLHRELNSIDQLGDFLKNKQLVSPIIWGSLSWVRISFPWNGGHLGANLTEEDLAFFGGVRLVDYIGETGLSLLPINESAQFIAHLFDGIFFDSNTSENNRNSQIIAWHAAASVRGLWSSRSHTAFVAWLLGNQYMYEALKDGGFSVGEYHCALRWYRFAEQLVSKTDSKELRLAIQNNLGIAQIVRGVMQHNPLVIRAGRKRLKRAVKGLGRNLFGDPLRIATNNLHLSKNIVFSPGKEHKKKKKDKKSSASHP